MKYTQRIKMGKPAAAGNGKRATDGSAMTSSSVTYTNTEGGRRQIIYLNGRAVGEVRGRTFYKRVCQANHMLHQFRAWASDIAVLEQVARLGAEYIQLEDTQTGNIWRAHIVSFWQYGIRFNFGYGEQIALPLKYWQVSGPSQAVYEQLPLGI